MLVPHGRENTQLGETGFAVQQPQNLPVFFRVKPMGCDQLVSNFGVGEFGVGSFGVCHALLRRELSRF